MTNSGLASQEPETWGASASSARRNWDLPFGDCIWPHDLLPKTPGCWLSPSLILKLWQRELSLGNLWWVFTPYLKIYNWEIKTAVASVEPEAAAESVYKAYTSGILAGGIYNISLVTHFILWESVDNLWGIKTPLHLITQVKVLTWGQWPLL